MNKDLLVQTKNLTRTYVQGGQGLTVLQNVDIDIYAGELVALVGPSGSGKSTLLHMIGLLDTPSSGSLAVNYQDTSKLNESQRTQMRREFIGFIYQFHYLLPEFTALENVVLPQMIAGVKQSVAEKRAKEILADLKMDHRFDHRPARLSGGEQQRVAIARALANEPKLILADEPTGNLDPETSEEVFDMLIGLVRNQGIGALIATHNMDLAEQMDRILELKNGRVLDY